MKALPLIILLAAVGLLLAAAGDSRAQGVPSTGAKEALVRVVTLWDSACTGSWRPSWDNMLDAWYDEIRNASPAPAGHGSRAWIADGFYKNGNIVDSDFIDPDLASWGRDHWNDRPDDVDIFFTAMHGNHNNGIDNWLGTVRRDEAGSGNCWANQAFMELGDQDLEFMHISSCHSMCDDNWDEWWSTFAGLHQIQGFYGIMWIAPVYVDRYEEFGDDAFYTGIPAAWIDNHYDTGIYTSGNDHCPVSMIAGTGAANVVNRACFEQYDWVYSDPVNPNYQWVMYVEGCNPTGHGPLNP